jgi:hypothetical protein
MSARFELICAAPRLGTFSTEVIYFLDLTKCRLQYQ